MKSGDTIGKYQLLDRIGAGGMGEVWLATATGYGGFAKTVVLKTLLAEHEHDPLFVEMLAHEARTCGKLNHPNLIEVFDFSKHGPVYLLAMEHVVGESLAQILRASTVRGWPIPAWFALRVAWECARGLESAHDAGVIHCDLSPSNIMVTYTGITKIVDFGVAHATSDGNKSDRLKGKFSYMPPERFKSLTTDRRTDVYALGVMLYLLFTGHLPFVAQSDAELVRKKLKLPEPPSMHGPIDPTIEEIILRALEPDPRARYQSASEILGALSPCLTGQLGAYGQHDAAGLVERLFAEDLPKAANENAVADLISVSFDVDIEIGEADEMQVSRAMTAPAHPTAKARAIGRGSDAVPALLMAPPPPAPAPAPPRPPIPDPLDDKTRVQSLFGSTRPATPPRRDDDWQWPFPRSRSK